MKILGSNTAKGLAIHHCHPVFEEQEHLEDGQGTQQKMRVHFREPPSCGQGASLFQRSRVTAGASERWASGVLVRYWKEKVIKRLREYMVEKYGNSDRMRDNGGIPRPQLAMEQDGRSRNFKRPRGPSPFQGLNPQHPMAYDCRRGSAPPMRTPCSRSMMIPWAPPQTADQSGRRWT